MKLQNFIEGLQIIAKYEKEEFCLRAEHDQFWVSETALPLSDEDSAKMLELGWFKDEYADGWNAFT